MNAEMAALSQKRDEILDQMRELDRMRRGSLSKQFFQTQAPEGPVQQGPYFVLQGYLKGRKFSRRVAAQDAPKVAEQVANHRRFQTLADAFVEVTERLTNLEENEPAVKKTSRRKSPGSG
jgi:hypothetical protein